MMSNIIQFIEQFLMELTGRCIDKGQSVSPMSQNLTVGLLKVCDSVVHDTALIAMPCRASFDASLT
jgi:hypothetical protein